jgi:hypothetical protein
MNSIRFAAFLLLASLLGMASASAQAPSLEDLERLHSGAPASSGGGGAGGRSSPGSGAPVRPVQSAGVMYGAIAFTADGSYSTAWKYKSKPEAEAYVATKCAAFGRGSCKVIGFVGSLCAGLASYNGTYNGRRWRLAYTGGGVTSSEAQRAAMNRCNADNRTRGNCQLRTVVCGDGR